MAEIPPYESIHVARAGDRNVPQVVSVAVGDDPRCLVGGKENPAFFTLKNELELYLADLSRISRRTSAGACSNSS